MKATTVQEKDEKVKVEESFPAKELLYNEKEATNSEPETSEPLSWNVKLEQSFNIFLTVRFYVFMLQLFADVILDEIYLSILVHLS